VSFVHYSINRDSTERREIEPYGLTFTSGRWYVVGRDTDVDVARKLRRRSELARLPSAADDVEQLEGRIWSPARAI